MTTKLSAWPAAALSASCALALLLSPVSGQPVKPRAPAIPEQTVPESALKKTETVTLNPFQVNTEKDEGFVASSSLAGGRLATDLKDTPVAYSVMTRDFIDAVGVTDLQSAMEWMPNVVSTMTAQGPVNDISGQPNGAQNVRGAAGGSANSRQQRNYFIFFAPMDSYALERYDMGRGPN